MHIVVATWRGQSMAQYGRLGSMNQCRSDCLSGLPAMFSTIGLALSSLAIQLPRAPASSCRPGSFAALLRTIQLYVTRRVDCAAAHASDTATTRLVSVCKKSTSPPAAIAANVRRCYRCGSRVKRRQKERQLIFTFMFIGRIALLAAAALAAICRLFCCGRTECALEVNNKPTSSCADACATFVGVCIGCVWTKPVHCESVSEMGGYSMQCVIFQIMCKPSVKRYCDSGQHWLCAMLRQECALKVAHTETHKKKGPAPSWSCHYLYVVARGFCRDAIIAVVMGRCRLCRKLWHHRTADDVDLYMFGATVVCT